MTQLDLAEALDVSRQAISKWERGVAEPTVENLVSIGQLFGVSLDELVGGEPQSEEPPVTDVAVAEKPEAAPPPKRTAWQKAVGGVLAACLLLSAVAAGVTIWSAVFKEPEQPRNAIIWMDDMEQEDVDVSQVENLPDAMIEQKE